MKIAIAQTNPKIGDCAGNTQRILQYADEARRQGASLVVFPELAIPGYFPRDLLDFDSLIEANLQGLARVAEAARGIAVVCGFVERNSGVGRGLHNSTALLRDGKIAAVYRKQLLPYYDVFEEERYFEPGDQPLFFEIDGKHFALAVCEDVWNFPEFVAHPYRNQPLAALRGKALDWVISPSASPFHLGKPALRGSVFQNAARFVGANILLVNQVGGNDDLIFDGGSFAVRADGSALASARVFEEQLLVVDEKKPVREPLPTTDEAWLAGALELGVRDYVRKTGFSKVCLGLSGGIDSAVVAAIAAGALGAANVSTVALPTRYTASASNDDAQAIATALGTPFRSVAIEGMFQSFESALGKELGRAAAGLTLENIQPRVRMTVLMALANEENRLVLNTSNKSELATGYSTLYGDSAGALAVIGDLTKSQVYALARHYNRAKPTIPERVITRAPSAELRENQTDQDSLPPYDILDPIVKDAVERGWGAAELKKAGHDPKWVDKFVKLYAISEYKRQQFPPILRVSSRAFGRGRRVPLASTKPWI